MSGDDLGVIFPREIAVGFRGETITVSPLTLRQLPAFITASRRVMGYAVSMALVLEEGHALKIGAVLLDVLERDAMAVVPLLVVATGRDEDFIADASIGEVATLLEAVIEANHDFFAQRLPALLGRLKDVAPHLPKPAPESRPPPGTETASGPTSSTDSSPGDTPEPMS